MVVDGQAEITVLTALRDEMKAVHALSIEALSPEMRVRHREAVRLTSGRSGGVEMW